MGRRPGLGPCEIEITHLGRKGLGVGLAPDGREVHVRGVPVGGRVLVQPFGRKDGAWQARRVALIRPPADYQVPPCAQFGLCGGCTLQELGLAAQREARWLAALNDVRQGLGEAGLDGVRLHGVRGGDAAYGYRNKVELSFGTRRYVSEAQQAAGLPHAGRFLGFHAPGRFDRVVDAPDCGLASAGMNALLLAVRETALTDAMPDPWDARKHVGFFRHLVLRHGHRTGQHLVALVTATPKDEAEQAAGMAVLAALQAAVLPEGERLVGALWLTNDGVADVARGPVHASVGEAVFEEHLRRASGEDVVFSLSIDAFFQTNTLGAEVLYQTVGEALGEAVPTLLDLYCGAGSIGLYLADRVGSLFGIEEVASAVADAGRNAERNGVQNARFVAAKVEDALHELSARGEGVSLIVDPPRVGLHPKVALSLASHPADALVYVACHPLSLGRDAAVLVAGGWRMTDVWGVDLFPQTGHLELVARFVREAV